MITRQTGTSSELMVRLSESQTEKLTAISDARRLKRTVAIRTLIDEAYERFLEERSESKLDSIHRSLQSLLADISSIRLQGEAVRSVEFLLKTETSALRASLQNSDRETRLLVAKIFFDLRAMVERHPAKAEIIAERERLMREA